MLPDAGVMDILKEMYLRYPANHEAVHHMAYEARRAFEEAKKELVMTLAGNDNYRAVAFSGGTAAISLLGKWKRLQKKQVVTTNLEHPSVDYALKRAGAFCVRLKTDSGGKIIPDTNTQHADAVFIHHVQSELGCVQSVDELFSNYPGAIKITDTIQSAAKMPLPETADILTVSGSKFGVPGAAALLVKKEYAAEIAALAENERSEYLTARISIPHFLVMTKVAAMKAKSMADELEHAKKLQKLCRELAFASGIACTVPEENSSPWICHLNLKKYEGAVIVRLLGNEGICVGSGTACSAETDKPSAALISLGFRQKEAFGGLRISWSPSTNLYDVKKLFEVLEKTLKNY